MMGILLVLLLSNPALLGPSGKAAPSADDPWLNDFLGPQEITADGRTVNAAAEYWTGVVGVPFDREIDLRIPPTAIDLNLDRTPDVTFSTSWKLKGGLLANPEVAGFVPTPNDPRGRLGRYSISTGFLGVREEMDPATRKGTGRFGFNCWYCHAGADTDGTILYGRPNVNINLGLILAASNAMNDDFRIRRPGSDKPLTEAELRSSEGLDDSFKFDFDGDGAVSIAEWRRAMRLPPARITQAMMLLAGPGRLDQSVDPRMDGFIPLANLQHYWLDKWGRDTYLSKAHSPKFSLFNPVSIPAALSGLGVEHYSWTGKDSSMKLDSVAAITSHMHTKPDRIADILAVAHDGPVDYELLSRAITLDYRNVGTSGRETDSVAADNWTDDVLEHADKDVLTKLPREYGADRLRALLTRHDWPVHGDPNDPLIARGRNVFTEETVGRVLNQRVVYGREALLPKDAKSVVAIVPLDRSQPVTATISVRCATCHNYSPGRLKRPLPEMIDEIHRCDLCHFDHPAPDEPGKFLSLADHMSANQLAGIQDCLKCHHDHPEFGPQVYSNSWLLPFDADGDGLTQGDESDDAAAGGIGTDAWLNIDSLFTQQLLPPERRHFQETYFVSNNAYKTPTESRYSHQGFGFVRVAPLITLARTAPYLHNGSVPTLEALLSPVGERPKTFPVGRPAQKFTLDTSLPGNGNMGHEYGAKLSADDKRALVRYLESLP